ncbi:MAG: hypothetical protein HFI42_04650 [Lachnospiraceae bacterium]|nr:hypothetical protein [Lachnospiraceae bacterium]MCI9149776.1 hypothetical protein [Lachnospiraceae bacterium]
MNYPITEAPGYLDQLIIYEIATKGFTSPEGPESGTFASLAEKMPYLEELGINGIWLSGHQQCHGSHFYNIWTEYACIRPDRLDESLGTEAEFKELVACAHRHNIRVFLDVITHGVMADSPLVREHPHWFAGGSWGMTDYDWYGGHEDLDEWWVNTWMWYITECGIDGFRLDVAHYRNDLWALIRKKAKEWGKELVIIAESGPAIRGVTDVIQCGETISHNWGRNHSTGLLENVADYCRDRQERREERYDVEICYEDGTVQTSQANEGLSRRKVLRLAGMEYDTLLVEEEVPGIAYVNQMGILRIENVYQRKPIHNIKISDWEGHDWNSNQAETLGKDFYITYQREGTALVARFPLRMQDGQRFVIQLSCHDNGWDGFPLDQDPYGLKGSRYLAGYACLLAPGIPIFMAGEEFHAAYRPLPRLTPGLFGEGEPGRGRWLYGAWLDWEQQRIPEKAAMLWDMKRLIALRKELGNFIKPCRMGERERNFCSIAYESREELPIPYYYQEGQEGLLVAANPWEDREAEAVFLWKELLEPGAVYQVQSLFGEPEELVETGEELRGHVWKIKRDKQPGGGLLVLRIRRMEEQP